VMLTLMSNDHFTAQWTYIVTNID